MKAINPNILTASARTSPWRVACGDLPARTLPGGASVRGFSLVEVMIAMGIFAVGFIAVAAMFPAGIILQKQTMSDVESQLVARNAAAMVRAREITFKPDGPVGDLPGQVDIRDISGNANGTLQPILNNTSATGISQTGNASLSLGTRWSLGDRSYPMSQGLVNGRKYYWVPMIRRTKNPASAADWVVLVFVLRRDTGSNYSFTPSPGFSNPSFANVNDGPDIPKVVGVDATANGNYFNLGSKKNDLYPAGGDNQADQVRPGDWVADNNGVTYQVIEADANGFYVTSNIPPTVAPATVKVWYAPPSEGKSSPCTRIIQLGGVIEAVQ